MINQPPWSATEGYSPTGPLGSKHIASVLQLLGEKHGSHETQLAATVLLKPSCVIRITIYLELVRQTITGELACLRKNRETAERLSAEEFDVTAASATASETLV